MNTFAMILLLFICAIVALATGQVLATRIREECPGLYAALRPAGSAMRFGVPWLRFACHPKACARTEGRLCTLIWAFRIALLVLIFVLVRLVGG